MHKEIIERHVLVLIIVDIALIILLSFNPDTAFIQYLILYMLLIGFVSMTIFRYLTRREYDYSNMEKWK
jgi:hypothetical protein